MNKILLITLSLIGGFFFVGCDKTSSTLAYTDNVHLIGQDMGTYTYDNVSTHTHIKNCCPGVYMNPERLPERQEMLHMNKMYMEDLDY